MTDARTDWLKLAAAPAFAAMAMLQAASAAGPADPFCAASHGASALGGMVPMYVLMSAIHGGPWIRLIAAQAGRTRRSSSLIRSEGPASVPSAPMSH